MANSDIPKDLSGEAANKCLIDACAKFGVVCPPPQMTARLLDKLVWHFLEETCVNPTFIINHPEITSPSATWQRSRSGLLSVLSFHQVTFLLYNIIFFRCAMYAQLNDPIVQCERFTGQLKSHHSGDDEAMTLDETFCTALEYGLPPTGGWGLGIHCVTIELLVLSLCWLKLCSVYDAYYNH